MQSVEFYLPYKKEPYQEGAPHNTCLENDGQILNLQLKYSIFLIMLF